MKLNDEAVSPVIGVILMVAIVVILTAVLAAFLYGVSGNIQKLHPSYVPLNETITIVDKVWSGHSDSFGYISTSKDTVYRVLHNEDYLRLRINHTYNVEHEYWSGGYHIISKINYEVLS